MHDSAGIMFVLANGNLTISQKVDWFLADRAAIHTAASASGPVLYRIYADHITKIWL